MIKRLRASRFRSLGKDVALELGALTALVGRNGAGKSNLVDALAFLADCMHLGLQGAVTHRGGIGVIRHVGTGGRPYDVSLHVEVEQEGVSGEYEVVLTGDRTEDYRVKREVAAWGSDRFVVESGAFSGPADLRPHLEPTGLALTALAGESRFAPLAQTLRSIAKYSIFPDALRQPHRYEPRRPMDVQGNNWVSILRDQPEETWKGDLVEVLHKLTGDVTDVKFEQVAGFLVLQFKHARGPDSHRRQWFDAAQESDGTLRVAGIMAALLQQPRPALIAIEEPELTVHPGALRVLHDYLTEGASTGQVVLTTHSPDLLDLLAADQVRVVDRIDEETQVAPLSEEQRAVVKAGLFSLGETMRSEGLRPQGEGSPPIDAPPQLGLPGLGA